MAPSGGLVSIAAPRGDVFRLARGPDPFAVPDWDYAHVDGTFGNRFDDPTAAAGIPSVDRFRMIYCATQRLGAFAETLARFRVSLSLLAALGTIDDDEPIQESLAGAIDPSNPRRGFVPADWRIRRRVGTTTLDAAPPFVDIFAPQTMQFFRNELADVASRLGVTDVDVSSLSGPHRSFTQQCARHIYDQKDVLGRPRYSGIRYISRHNPNWECWAVFDHHFRHAPGCPGFPQHIAPDDRDLLEVASLFELTIEVISGNPTFIRP